MLPSNKKICLFAARLDTTFKPGPVPQKRGPIPPIREHWVNFFNRVLECEPNATVIELPLWQMTPEIVNKAGDEHDIVLMPHKQRGEEFWHPNLRFYMQTVFPEAFTIDVNGWGANLSFLPLKGISKSNAYDFFNYLAGRINQNVSKFDQPPQRFFPKNFDVLFVCQIPHDETIKYHSDISVEDALKGVLETARKKNYSVLVKGHPVNPGSMKNLFEISAQYADVATWIDDISIHDAIRACKVVALVNSGVGFEAMLHSKPIFSYGRSEYQNFVHYKKEVDIHMNCMLDYAPFIYEFFEYHTLDTSDLFQFQRNFSEIINA